MNIDVAVKNLESAGLRSQVIGNGQYVLQQSPSPGALVPLGSVIELKVANKASARP
jgi:beta-lactam-binding protein with PASTA domain